MTLGQKLKEAREAKGKSLRDIERETGNRISNGYLSLLESNTVKQPSPIHLKLLAEYFGSDYDELMTLAGYSPPAVAKGEGTRGSSKGIGAKSSLSTDDLTDEETALVEEYVGLLRRARKPLGRKPRQ